jgi:probable rRNA maturation factor
MIEVAVLESETVAGLFNLDSEALSRYGESVLSGCGTADADVNIVLVDDDMMTDLNERYKKQTGTTDVLSFRLSDEDAPLLEGEVYVSLARAQAQATDYGVSFTEEVFRLVTHGILHLAGRIHDTDEALDAMTQETDRYLASRKHGEEPIS